MDENYYLLACKDTRKLEKLDSDWIKSKWNCNFFITYCLRSKYQDIFSLRYSIKDSCRETLADNLYGFHKTATSHSSVIIRIPIGNLNPEFVKSMGSILFDYDTAVKTSSIKINLEGYADLISNNKFFIASRKTKAYLSLYLYIIRYLNYSNIYPKEYSHEEIINYLLSSKNLYSFSAALGVHIIKKAGVLPSIFIRDYNGIDTYIRLLLLNISRKHLITFNETYNISSYHLNNYTFGIFPNLKTYLELYSEGKVH